MSSRLTSPSSRYREAATLVRQAAGDANAYGEWEAGAETATAITVDSYPPAAATVRNILPEGERLRDMRTFLIYTEVEPLRVGANQTEGDVIVYQGIRYRVRHVSDYRPHGPVEALGVRIEGQSD